MRREVQELKREARTTVRCTDARAGELKETLKGLRTKVREQRQRLRRQARRRNKSDACQERQLRQRPRGGSGAAPALPAPGSRFGRRTTQACRRRWKNMSCKRDLLGQVRWSVPHSRARTPRCWKSRLPASDQAAALPPQLRVRRGSRLVTDGTAAADCEGHSHSIWVQVLLARPADLSAAGRSATHGHRSTVRSGWMRDRRVSAQPHG